MCGARLLFGGGAYSSKYGTHVSDAFYTHVVTFSSSLLFSFGIISDIVDYTHSLTDEKSQLSLTNVSSSLI